LEEADGVEEIAQQSSSALVKPVSQPGND